ncbi:DUF2767 domain-containing protein [Salmonella enterica subsp. enterica serovar Napoli]|nr:DUF2767 domain-containing protein [Salmonella enterica subsp. enterica serovar Napoli]ECY4608612.1 DUF2767 domain-containing protein [Salmonella enterica subsp. enterica serovar Typhimurium]MLQ57091.1 DUF2767 domain-containing protein [Salmonella enterica subsp. enterica serovar Napoli]
MNEEDKMKTIYYDVCCVIGRAVLMLKESDQPVTVRSISLMLQVHSDQNSDAYLSKVYTVAQNVMAQNQNGSRARG